MTLKQYLVLMTLATGLCATAFGFVVVSIDPLTASFWGIALFYASFFLSVLGIFSLIGFAIESMLFNRETIVFRKVRKSFRQGVLFATLLCVVLWLAHAQLLFWWTIVLLAIGLSLLEFVFSREKRRL